MQNLENVTVQTIEQLTAAVQKIAPNAWEYAIRQQTVDAWSGIIACSFIITIAASATVMMWRAAKRADEDSWYFGAALVSLISGLVAIMSIIIIQSDITALLNPEYAAMKDLAAMVIK